MSKEWLVSSWCKSEVDAARLMGKKVIVALIGIDKSQVPPDLTDEQYIDLTRDPDAYRRLKEGLKRAGLDPTTFPFPSGRRPYPGFAYLEEQDAAVFFGRDAQIVRGLDEIRRLARAGVSRMLVILGASGSGKSSFLRAGLWPRLKRDDLAWLPLPVIRPERAAITGKYGLAQALQQVISEPRFADGMRKRDLPRSRADIQDFIVTAGDGLARLFAALHEIAQASDDAAPPTILLAVDQGEELFNEEGRDEAERFIEILTQTLTADPRALAILVMRSDSIPLLQRDPSLADLPKDAFTLDMMLEGSYRAVIEGPARLVEPPLKIDPELVDALLEDISGQDALPLLAFTLAHLYDNARADNELTLAGYDRIGRVKGVIDKTVAQAFEEAVARGEAPKDEKAQLALARAAFIPHLAQVNAAGQFVRHVSARDQIPTDARLLIDCFADQRLLIRDRRKDADGKDVDVLEVAHEALLRQPPFSEWLADDREFLVWRERLSQARAAFADDKRGLLTGRELAIARGYMQTRAEREIEPSDQAFIRDSIAADDKRRANEAEQARAKTVAEKQEQERRVRDAERIAMEQRKAAVAQNRFARAAMVGLVIALGLAAVAGWQYFDARAQRETADQAKNDAFQQRDRARKAESAAKEASAKAEASAEEAKANSRQAQTAQSRFLEGLAQQQRTGEGDAGSAVLLALEALPDAASGVDRPYVPEAELQLDSAWRLLGERLVLGHADAVRSAAFSPDGKRIVTASWDKTARVWDAKSGKPIGEPLIGHSGRVVSAAFSPDGRRIVTASDDKTARVWDAETGKPIGELLKGHNDGVMSAAFSPDGKRIVTGSHDHTARLWDADTGQPIGEPLGDNRNGWVASAAFSPDGRRIVTAFGQETAGVWDAATGQPIGEPLKGHSDSLYSAAFSPDGKRIVTASADKTARIWDAATGKPIGEPLKGHGGEVYSAAFSPDGKRIVTASKDKTARIWDAATGKPIGQPLTVHDSKVFSAAFSPGGTHIVTASGDDTARLWDATLSRPIGEPLTEHHGPVTLAAFGPDGTRVVTMSDDGTARLWDVATGKPTGEPFKGHDLVLTAAFIPEGIRIVTASTDKTARVWDAETGKPIGEPLKGHNDGVISAAFSPDGKRIVTTSNDDTARLWDAATGQPIGDPLRGTGTEGNSAAFSPDGKRIVTADSLGYARIWDAETGKPLEGHDGGVLSAAFSPSGKRIITASWDKTARIWDAATGQQIGEPLKGHGDQVVAAAFSPNGKRIVTASKDKTARIWDAASGQPIATLNGHGGAVVSAAFSPDGRRIVTGSDDETARIWDTFADTQDFVSHAKAAIPRCLTLTQREAFFLPPEPPAWCIEMDKWPYNTPEWKEWLARKRAGKTSPLPAN
jgi:WD40 repeat protein